MSYFKHHVFVCTNQRDGGEQCCNNVGGSTCLPTPRIASAH